MIELKIDGVCKNCVFKELLMTGYGDKDEVRCRHDQVCKFVGDPEGVEKMQAVKKAMMAKLAAQGVPVLKKGE